MRYKKSIICSAALAALLFTYAFSYIGWKKDHVEIFTSSQYSGSGEELTVYYLSVNDENWTYLPAIWLDIFFGGADIFTQE